MVQLKKGRGFQGPRHSSLVLTPNVCSETIELDYSIGRKQFIGGQTTDLSYENREQQLGQKTSRLYKTVSRCSL